MKAITDKSTVKRSNVRERADRATTEQVLDPRTRLVLWKFLNNGFLKEINGCLSTGKEANVYHGVIGSFNVRQPAQKVSKQKQEVSESQSLESTLHPTLTNQEPTSTPTSSSNIESTSTPTSSSSNIASTSHSDESTPSNETEQPPESSRDASIPNLIVTTQPPVEHVDNALPFDEVAIKIYKTSILVFKDRDRYVAGEFRFRRGYSKHNPRKMVKVWAEKEMRNLLRMYSAGINCPRPLLLRSHVLVMEFIGKAGWPAPKLKDVQLTERRLHNVYLQIVKMMRTLYHTCKLVHADLSEYNILYYKGRAFIIDVSQAIEHDHPNSMEFLRMDCTNITQFFGHRHSIPVMTSRELFEFVTDPSLEDDAIPAYLERMHEKALLRGSVSAAEQVDDAVFQRSYIPRTIDDVEDIEGDMMKAQAGDSKDIYYQKVLGLNPLLIAPIKSAPKTKAKLPNNPKKPQCSSSLTDASATDDPEELSSTDEDSDDGEGDPKTDDASPADPKDLKAAKKEHKKKVKEENRVRRQNKIPKHMKKRKIKLISKKIKKK